MIAPGGRVASSLFFLAFGIVFACEGIASEWSNPSSSVSLNKLIHAGVAFLFLLLTLSGRAASLSLSFSLHSSLLLSAFLLSGGTEGWACPPLSSLLPLLLLYLSVRILPSLSPLPSLSLYSLLLLHASTQGRVDDLLPFVFHVSFVCSLSAWKPSTRLVFLFSVLLLGGRCFFSFPFSESQAPPLVPSSSSSSRASLPLLLFLSFVEVVFLVLDTWYDEDELCEEREDDAEEEWYWPEGSLSYGREDRLEWRVESPSPRLFHVLASLSHSLSLLLFSCRSEGACDTIRETMISSIHSSSVSSFLLGVLPSLASTRVLGERTPFLLPFLVLPFPLLDLVLSCRGILFSLSSPPLPSHPSPLSFLFLTNLSRLVTSLLVSVSLFVPYSVRTRILPPSPTRWGRRLLLSVPASDCLLLLAYLLPRSFQILTLDSNLEVAVVTLFHFVVVTFCFSLLSLLFPFMTSTAVVSSLLLSFEAISSASFLLLHTPPPLPFDQERTLSLVLFLTSFPLATRLLLLVFAPSPLVTHPLCSIRTIRTPFLPLV